MAYQSNQQPYPSSSDSYPPHHHIPTRSHQSSSDSSDSIDQQTIAESTYHPVHPKHLSHTDTYHEDDPYDLHRYSSEKPHNSTSYPTGDFLNHRSQTIQDTEQANDKYPPTHLAAASSAPVSRRPPVWKTNILGYHSPSRTDLESPAGYWGPGPSVCLLPTRWGNVGGIGS